jgi:hypothetical protein
LADSGHSNTRGACALLAMFGPGPERRNFGQEAPDLAGPARRRSVPLRRRGLATSLRFIGAEMTFKVVIYRRVRQQVNIPIARKRRKWYPLMGRLGS